MGYVHVNHIVSGQEYLIVGTCEIFQKSLEKRLHSSQSLVMLASAIYFKAIHNRGLGLILLLYGQLHAHLVWFITFQTENTPFTNFPLLPPTLTLNLNQPPTYSTSLQYHLGKQNQVILVQSVVVVMEKLVV